MDFRNKLSTLETKVGDVHLADSATTYTILHDKKYSLEVKLLKGKVNDVSCPGDLIEGSKRDIWLVWDCGCWSNKLLLLYECNKQLIKKVA